jgi:hypothetical protein
VSANIREYLNDPETADDLEAIREVSILPLAIYFFSKLLILTNKVFHLTDIKHYRTKRLRR